MFFVETSSTKFLQNIWRTHKLLIQFWSPLCHWRRFILGERKFESTWLPDMKVICYRYKRGGDTSLPRNFFNTSHDGWHNILRGRINYVIFGSIEKSMWNIGAASFIFLVQKKIYRKFALCCYSTYLCSETLNAMETEIRTTIIFIQRQISGDLV